MHSNGSLVSIFSARLWHFTLTNKVKLMIKAVAAKGLRENRVVAAAIVSHENCSLKLLYELVLLNGYFHKLSLQLYSSVFLSRFPVIVNIFPRYCQDTHALSLAVWLSM